MIEGYRSKLVDIFRLLYNIKHNLNGTIEESYKLQRDLINEIIQVELNIQNNKKEISKLKKLFKNKISKEENISLGQKINFLREENQEYKKLVYILKSVGDGLAFVYLDKWDIKPLIFKESSGFISGKEGLKNELSVLNEIFETGRIALLNDVTNCLRYGDITIPVNGFPHMLEVKSSKAYSKRNKRQDENMRKVAKYLECDEIEGLYSDNQLMKRKSVGHKEKNYIGKLNRVIQNAYNKSASFEKVEEGLYYYCWIPPGDHGRFDSILSELDEPFAFFINEAKYDNLGYYPFTLSIEDPENLYDFYNGELIILVFVDRKLLFDKLQKKGFELESGDDYWLFYVMNNVRKIGISEHFFNRIGYEFLSLDWFINEIEFLFIDE